MEKPIRVIDGGGSGFRRADVYGREVKNFEKTKRGEISNPQKLIEFACENLPNDCLGIFYAMAGEIKDGIVVKSPQIPWINNYNLMANTLSQLAQFEKTDVKVLVKNDMDSAAAGMAFLLPDYPYFIAITWSSGIGLRVYNNGRILACGEAGHISLDLSLFAPLCGCGKRGCAESICGGESVKRRVIAETEVLGIRMLNGVHPCGFLDFAFDDKQPWAINIYHRIAEGMGIFLANLQINLRPPAIIWKGTFAQNFLPRFEAKIRYFMRIHLTNPEWEKEVKFVFSPEPEKDSLIGSAILFKKEFK